MARASNQPYIGVSLGSRSITIARVDETETAPCVRVVTDEDYASWFAEALTVRTWLASLPDNAALKKAIADAKKQIEEEWGISYISSVAVPWEIKTNSLAHFIRDTLVSLDALDPRMKDFLPQAIVDSGNAARVAFTSNQDETSTWHHNPESTIMAIEYNEEFLSFRLLHLNKQGSSPQDSFVFPDLSTTELGSCFLSERRRYDSILEARLSHFISMHANDKYTYTKANGTSITVSNSRIRAVVLTGVSPEDTTDELREIIQSVIGEYPDIELWDSVPPVAVTAVGAAMATRNMLSGTADGTAERGV